MLCSSAFKSGRGSVRSMRDLLILGIHLVITVGISLMVQRAGRTIEQSCMNGRFRDFR